MSIDSIDIGVQEGAPIHLFAFYYEGTYYLFTNHPNKVTALGYDWTPKAIGLGDIEITNDINKNNIDLIFSRDDTFARNYTSGVQDELSTVTVYRGYQNDPDAEWIAYWKGRTSNTTVKKNQITLTCESVFTSLKRPGIRGKYSKHCRHVLYGRGCGLDVEDASLYINCIVNSVSADGLTFNITEAGLESDGYYLSGMVRSADGAFRTIFGHSGANVSVYKPYPDNITGTTVRLYAGCDRSMDVCNVRFNNFYRFGGFPYTPEYNIMGGGQIR